MSQPHMFGIYNFLEEDFFGFKLYLLVLIIALFLILECKGVVDVQLIGGNKKAIRRIRRN